MRSPDQMQENSPRASLSSVHVFADHGDCDACLDTQGFGCGSNRTIGPKAYGVHILSGPPFKASAQTERAITCGLPTCRLFSARRHGQLNAG